MTVPLTPDSLVLVANPDGSTYGGQLPSIQELADAAATARAYRPGFAVGDGGTVTQATNKSTAVTLNEWTGQITMNAAALAVGAIVSFTLNNSTIAATDQVVVTHHATGTFGAYGLNGRATGAGTAIITVRNNSASSLSEAIVLKFSIIKSVTT